MLLIVYWIHIPKSVENFSLKDFYFSLSWILLGLSVKIKDLIRYALMISRTNDRRFCAQMNHHTNFSANNNDRTASTAVAKATIPPLAPAFPRCLIVEVSGVTGSEVDVLFKLCRCFDNSTKWGKILQKSGLLTLKSNDCRAKLRLAESDVSILPNVGSFSIIKLYNPVNIVDTLHMGFHVSGWKSDMERHSLRFGWNLPEGVSIITDGGFKGYSFGKINFPW